MEANRVWRSGLASFGHGSSLRWTAMAQGNKTTLLRWGANEWLVLPPSECSAATDSRYRHSKTHSMSRTINTVINGVVGFLIGYFVVARFTSDSDPVKTGVWVGTIVAIIAHLGYEKPAALDRLESENSAEE